MKGMNYTFYQPLIWFLLVLIISIGCKSEPANGLDFRIFDGTSVESLAHAVENENTTEIVRLIKSGVPVNYQESKYGSSVLMLASIHNKKRSVKALVQNGANPNLRDLQNLSAMHMSSGFYQCNLDQIKIMVEDGGGDIYSSIDGSSSMPDLSPLEIACSKSCRNVFHYYIDKGVKLDLSKDSKLLKLALGAEDLYFLRYLLIDKNAEVMDYVTIYQPDSPARDTITLSESLIKDDWYKPGSNNYKYREEILEYLKSNGLE
ncbi:MAG: ankyrin repeat protein [Flavobacteriaceae bacterium]|jgi:ankyrin repeat protein